MASQLSPTDGVGVEERARGWLRFRHHRGVELWSLRTMPSSLGTTAGRLCMMLASMPRERRDSNDRCTWMSGAQRERTHRGMHRVW